MATRWCIGLICALAAGRARAECLGSCADDLAAALFSIVVYGLIGIVLLVMLVRRKWRRAGVWALGTIALLAVGVPLVSQAWGRWTLRGMEGREVVGTPPALAGRTPLLLTPDEYCLDSACEAVMRGRGAAGVHVVLTRALDGLDLIPAVSLAALPLELWVQPVPGGEITRRVLSAAERREAADRIDYLVVTTWPYSSPDPGPIEAALRANPALSGMGESEAVRLLLAPIQPKAGLALASVKPDLLDLTLGDRPLAIPLAPRNRQGAGNGPVGVEAAVGAICPASDPDGICRSLVER